MSVVITYNGVNPFGTRTPFVSISRVPVDVNGYISLADVVTISGTRPRPSCTATFTDYNTDIQAIADTFKKQFKVLRIAEDGGTIFTHSSSKVTSVSFPESSFSGFYEFEITLECIVGFNGDSILDPVDEWSSSSGVDGTITLNHTVSGRGIGNQAYEKARAFVFARSGLGSGFAFTGNGMVFVHGKGIPVAAFPQISRGSSFNRLTGEFRMTETWLHREGTTLTSYGVITWDANVSESEGVANVGISGTVQVSKFDIVAAMVKARQTFNAIDFQARAQAEYNYFGGTKTLGNLLSLSVNEDEGNGLISFSISWDSQTESSPYIVDTSTVSTSNLGEPTCFNYSGTVRSDSGHPNTRFAAVKTFFENVNWSARVAQKWTAYGNGEVLSSSYKNKSVSFNPFTGEATFSTTHCVDAGSQCGAVEAFKYTLAWKPSILQYAVDPVLHGMGQYVLQNLGYRNRQTFSITGTARRLDCSLEGTARSDIKARVNMLMVRYFPATDRILAESSIEVDKGGNYFSFNFSWNAKAPAI